MRLKQILVVCCIIGINIGAYGQGFANGKGASMIRGLASYSNTGTNSDVVHDLYRTTDLTISPSLDYFIFKHIFVGCGLNYSIQRTYLQIVTIGLGPEVGYVFGNQESKVFPYINAGFNYEIEELTLF